MRDASTYRGARRNACRPLFYWIDGERHKSKEREKWPPRTTTIKQRTAVYTGKMYPAGWRTPNERGDRASLMLSGAAA